MGSSSFLTPQCISAYVVRKTSEGARYLLIRRCSAYLNGTWQMVSGKIEPHETASEAAFREIQEETGLVPDLFYSADAVEIFHMLSGDQIGLVPVFVAFVSESSVRLSPKEHDAYEWLTLEEARNRLVFAEQKRVIQEVHDRFILNTPKEQFLIPPPSKRTFSRTGVYGIAENNQKLLLVKQSKGPYAGKWDLPGGGIEAGETIEEALRREWQEELAMGFEFMQFFANLTTTVDDLEKKAIFHQIGLIYQIFNPYSLKADNAQMEHAWIEFDQIGSKTVSPFVLQTINLLKNPILH